MLKSSEENSGHRGWDENVSSYYDIFQSEIIIIVEYRILNELIGKYILELIKLGPSDAVIGINYN